MITILLPSGLRFSNADGMLRAKFGQYSWERYDADRPVDVNNIEAADIDRANRLGARADKAAYESAMKQHGRDIRRLLGSLPVTPLEDLEDTDFAGVRAAVVELFELLLNLNRIGLAGATKWLHPFRPAFLPILDSWVDYYYWWSTSIRDEVRFRRMAGAKWGEYVFELLSLMRDDVRGARTDIDRVLQASSTEDYARASRIRVIESLIWYYYARSGAALDAEVPPPPTLRSSVRAQASG